MVKYTHTDVFKEKRMKKVSALVALILCCLIAFSACDYTPYLYYKRRALAIENECKEYSLVPTSELSGTELSREISYDDYVELKFLLEPSNDDAEDIEFYNDNGLYVYISQRVLHVFNNGVLYDLTPKYFREKSQAYNQIEQIWADKYGVAPSEIPNYIVGAIVFDGNLFILAQNDPAAQLVFNRQHQLNLWRFNLDDGSVAFCGFCVKHDERGRAEHILSPSGNGIAIVKNA